MYPDSMLEFNANRDIDDAIAYIQATDYAISRLEALLLCNRLIMKKHKVLIRDSGEGCPSPKISGFPRIRLEGEVGTSKNASVYPALSR